MYSYSVEYEDSDLPQDKMDVFIDDEIGKIRDKINTLIAEDITRIKQPPNLRIEVVDGVKYPHVTDIISLGITPAIPHIEEHAYLGNLLDACMKEFVDEGTIVYPDNIRPTPNITVTFTDIFDALRGWWKEYGSQMHFDRHSVKGINTVHRYLGELDATGTYHSKKAIFDFKKTKKISGELKDKYFMQMAAYANFDKTTKPEVLVICSPFNPPIVTDEIGKYYEMFLAKRKEYKTKFGV